MLRKTAPQTFFKSRNVPITQQHVLSIIFFNSGVKYEYQDTVSVCFETTQIFRNQLLKLQVYTEIALGSKISSLSIKN